MKNFKNLSIKTKILTIVFINIIFFSVIAGVFYISSKNQKNGEDNIILNGKVLSYFKDADMMHDALRADVFKLTYAAENDRSLIEDVKKDYLEHANMFQESISKIEEINQNEKIKNQISDVKPALEAYITFCKNLNDLASKEDSSSRNEFLDKIKEFQNVFDVLAVRNEKLAELILQINDEAKDSLEEQSSNSLKLLFSVILITIFISVILGFYIANLISKPLKIALEHTNSIASGDLTQSIESSTKDEVGLTLEGMKRMQEKLKEIISTIVVTADNISSASGEMNNSAQLMSEGATEQASSAEEVSSSMEEMAANIQQNTDNAKQTEKIADKASTDIREGNSAVNKTVDSMKIIANKIGIIGEISRQTNLLALNAAVEAARAGEHGKGFAVVAAEVRKLAERSQTAASEIDQLSATSVDVAIKSGKLLEEMVPSIQKTSDLVQEIAAASIEQNTGADQINNAIQQLNQVIQQNAATAEELSASSEELSAQAESLKDLVGFFKVDVKEGRDTLKKSNTIRKIQPQIKSNTVRENRTNSGNGVHLDLGKSGQNDSLDKEYEKY